jgi:hypothetical protein
VSSVSEHGNSELGDVTFSSFLDEVFRIFSP